MAGKFDTVIAALKTGDVGTIVSALMQSGLTQDDAADLERALGGLPLDERQTIVSALSNPNIKSSVIAPYVPRVVKALNVPAEKAGTPAPAQSGGTPGSNSALASASQGMGLSDVSYSPASYDPKSGGSQYDYAIGKDANGNTVTVYDDGTNVHAFNTNTGEYYGVVARGGGTTTAAPTASPTPSGGGGSYSETGVPSGAPGSPSGGGSAVAVAGGGAPADITDFVKAREGFNSKAVWDYNQWTIGYGTKATAEEVKNGTTYRPGDPAMEARLQTEIAKAASYVDSLNPNLPANVRTGLISAAYNLGSFGTGLTAAVKSGNPSAIATSLGQYTNAGGSYNKGVANRRAAEVALISGSAQTVQAAAGKGQTIGPGSSKADIMALQQQLAAKGYNIAVDGIYGPQTARAVADYQNSTKGNPSTEVRTDAVAGPRTMASLVQSVLGGSTTSIPSSVASSMPLGIATHMNQTIGAAVAIGLGMASAIPGMSQAVASLTPSSPGVAAPSPLAATTGPMDTNPSLGLVTYPNAPGAALTPAGIQVAMATSVPHAPGSLGATESVRDFNANTVAQTALARAIRDSSRGTVSSYSSGSFSALNPVGVTSTDVSGGAGDFLYDPSGFTGTAVPEGTTVTDWGSADLSGLSGGTTSTSDLSFNTTSVANQSTDLTSYAPTDAGVFDTSDAGSAGSFSGGTSSGYDGLSGGEYGF